MISFILFLNNMYEYTFVGVCIWLGGPLKGQKRVTNNPELELHMTVSCMK